MPLLSFIITYHNEPQSFICECLQSVMQVPVEPDEREVIVVDDGSRESAEPWLRPICPELRYERQPQGGLSSARNHGIELSRGEYLQFVDADDCLLPKAYGRVLSLLRDEAPDAVLFHLRKAQVDSTRSPHVSRMSGPWFLQHRNHRAAAPGYVFRRQCLAGLRFYPGIFHEDELFTAQMFLRLNTLLEVDTAPYFYRQHSGTIISTATPEHLLKRDKDIRFILNELRRLGDARLERYICQLATDFLWVKLRRPGGLAQVRRSAGWLRQDGFLPLPLRAYSLRYFLTALACRLL